MSNDGSDEVTGPRVVDLPNPDKMQAALEEMLRALPALIAYTDVTAKIRRANYEALLREGFSAEQALYLCWR